MKMKNKKTGLRSSFFLYFFMVFRIFKIYKKLYKYKIKGNVKIHKIVDCITIFVAKAGSTSYLAENIPVIAATGMANKITIIFSTRESMLKGII